MSKKKKKKVNTVTVRWFDGYLEKFECQEVRFGAYILWMRLTKGVERIIPFHQVRWFSQSIESHQKIKRDKTNKRIKKKTKFAKTNSMLFKDHR